MSLSLRDEGFPYKKIYQGRKWVGRTYKAADGTYTCQIGGKNAYTGAASHDEAFREGGARFMGHASYAALQGRNRVVRQENRARRSHAQAVAYEFIHAKTLDERFAALDKIFPRS